MSARKTEEVSPSEQRYVDGSSPRVLDVIDVPLFKALPKDYQKENWLLNPDHQWERVSRVAWNELAQFADLMPQLWVNGHNTYNGVNDRIPLSVAYSLGGVVKVRVR